MGKIGVLYKDGFTMEIPLEEVSPNKVLLFLKKFSERHVTDSSENPDFVKVKNMDDFFKEFTENGAFTFDVEFDDGSTDKIEIRNMSGFDIDTISKNTSYKAEFDNREKMIKELEKTLTNPKGQTEIKEKTSFALDILSSIE